MHTHPPFRWWLIDLASPRLLKMMAKTWGRAVAAGNAPFRFAPTEGTRFFGAHGWREAEFRATWDESLRLKRTVPLAWLWNFIGRFYPRAKREEMRRMSGTVLLERRGKGGGRREGAGAPLSPPSPPFPPPPFWKEL